MSADAIWVPAHRAGDVYRIDPQTNAIVARVTIPGWIAVDGIASSSDSLWVGQCKFGHSGVARIDIHTNAITATVAGPAACGVAVGDGVWVSNTTADEVWRIDPATNAVVAKIPLSSGSFPGPLVVAESSVWVVNAGNGTVSRIDPATNKVVATIPVGQSNGSDPDTAAGAESILAGAGKIWVGNDLDNKLYKIDPATNAATALDIGAVSRGDWRVMGLGYGSDSVWAQTASCEIAQINPPSGKVVKRLDLCPGGHDTSGVAVAFGSLWISFPEVDAVWRIQP